MTRLKVLKTESTTYLILQIASVIIALIKSFYHFNITATFALILALIFGVLQRVIKLEMRYYG